MMFDDHDDDDDDGMNELMINNGLIFIKYIMID